MHPHPIAERLAFQGVEGWLQGHRSGFRVEGLGVRSYCHFSSVSAFFPGHLHLSLVNWGLHEPIAALLKLSSNRIWGV